MSEQQSSCAAPELKSDAVEYRDVAGFPGYQVGSDGSVWSSHNNKYGPSDRWKRMKPSPNEDGYMFVRIRAENGKLKECAVHRMVLTAFAGARPAGCEGRHFPDRNPANNALSNLTWGTCAQNSADKKVHGTQPFGADVLTTKLTRQQAIAIVDLLKNTTLGIRAIAKRFSIGKSTIQKICSGLTWVDVSGGKIQRPDGCATFN